MMTPLDRAALAMGRDPNRARAVRESAAREQALMEAARGALHVADEQTLTDSFLRTLRNNVRACANGDEEWSESMERLARALADYDRTAPYVPLPLPVFGPTDDTVEPTPLDSAPAPASDALRRDAEYRARQERNYSDGPCLRARKVGGR